MPLEFDATIEEGQSTDIYGDGGNYLHEPGIYHFSVLGVNDEPHNKEGVAISAIEVSLEVLDGTTPGQKGKKLDLKLFNGHPNQKDKGLFAKRRQACFFVAANLMRESDFGKRISIDTSKAKGQQIVAAVEKGKDRNGNDTKFLEVRFSDIWHVDNPAVGRNKVPLNAEAIAFIPKQFRRDPKSFEIAKSSQSESGQKSSSPDLGDL